MAKKPFNWEFKEHKPRPCSERRTHEDQTGRLMDELEKRAVKLQSDASNANNRLDTMQKWMSGEPIQWQANGSDTSCPASSYEWQDCEFPKWNWSSYNYRVTPEEERCYSRYMNIYSSDVEPYGKCMDSGALHRTRELADEQNTGSRVACILVTFSKGQYDD